jgi:hypothetical protein
MRSLDIFQRHPDNSISWVEAVSDKSLGIRRVKHYRKRGNFFLWNTRNGTHVYGLETIPT